MKSPKYKRLTSAQKQQLVNEGKFHIAGKKAEIVDRAIIEGQINDENVSEFNSAMGSRLALVADIWGGASDIESARDESLITEFSQKGKGPEKHNLANARNILKSWSEEVSELFSSLEYDLRQDRSLDLKRILGIESIEPLSTVKITPPAKEGISISADLSDFNKFLDVLKKRQLLNSKDIERLADIVFEPKTIEYARRQINDLLETTYFDAIDDYTRNFDLYNATINTIKFNLSYLGRQLSLKKDIQVAALRRYAGYRTSEDEIVNNVDDFLSNIESELMNLEVSLDLVLLEDIHSQFAVTSFEINALDEISTNLLKISEDNDAIWRNVLENIFAKQAYKHSREESTPGVREGFLHVLQIEPAFRAKRVFYGGLRSKHPQKTVDSDRLRANYDILGNEDNLTGVGERILSEGISGVKSPRKSVKLEGEGAFAGGLLFTMISRTCNKCMDLIGDLRNLIDALRVDVGAGNVRNQTNIFQYFKNVADNLKKNVASRKSFEFETFETSERGKTIKFLFSVSKDLENALASSGMEKYIADEVINTLAESVFGRADLIDKVEDLVYERFDNFIENI